MSLDMDILNSLVNKFKDKIFMQDHSKHRAYFDGENVKLSKKYEMHMIKPSSDDSFLLLEGV